jgi:hypothetical protein
VQVLNDILDSRASTIRSQITTEDEVGLFVNHDNFLTIYNFKGLNTNITNAYSYLRLNTQLLGSLTQIQNIAPKYDSKGIEDSRYVIFVGADSTSAGLRRLGVIIFDTKLIDLPPAS